MSGVSPRAILPKWSSPASQAMNRIAPTTRALSPMIFFLSAMRFSPSQGPWSGAGFKPAPRLDSGQRLGYRSVICYLRKGNPPGRPCGLPASATGPEMVPRARSGPAWAR